MTANEFQQMVFQLFDELTNNQTISREDIIEITGSTAKHLLKQATAMHMNINVKKLKHMDFVMMPHEVVREFKKAQGDLF